MRHFLHPLFILLCLPLFLWQCDDDSGGVQNTDPSGKRVLILNEGFAGGGARCVPQPQWPAPR